MRIANIVTVLTLALLVFQQAASAQSDSVLRWKLEKGQKYKVISEQKMTNKVDTPMGVQEMPMEMTATIEWEVTDAKDGNFKVKQVVKRLQMAMESPFGSINIDTDDKDQEADGQMAMIADQISQAVGEETELEFNERGQVKKKEKSGDAEQNMGPFMMGDNSDLSSQLFFDLPEAAATAGMTWKQKVENEVPGGEIVMDSQFKYIGQSSNLHEIEMESEVSGGMAQGPQQVDIDEGSMKGKLYFNNETGCLERAEMNQEMIMVMDAGGIEITITNETETKTTFELVK